MQNETNLVPLEMHNRLTAGPAPWTATRLPSELWHVARAVYGTSNEDDEKRCYRTVQAALWKLATTPAPAPLTDEQIDKTAKRVIPVAAYMGMFEYAAFSKEDADRTVRHFARAIETAHGIKVSTKESNQ